MMLSCISISHSFFGIRVRTEAQKEAGRITVPPGRRLNSRLPNFITRYSYLISFKKTFLSRIWLALSLACFALSIMSNISYTTALNDTKDSGVARNMVTRDRNCKKSNYILVRIWEFKMNEIVELKHQ